MSSPPRASRVFDALFLLYPAAFRDLYGADAKELFHDRLVDARARGWPAVVALWGRTVPDLLVHGGLERLSATAAATKDHRIPSMLGHALRSLRRAPAMTVVVISTLAVGIGANVAMFGVLRGVLLEPLPYPGADRLVQLWETNPEVDQNRQGPSPLNFVDWREQASSFESMAAWFPTSGTYRTDEWVEELRSAQVTVDFFRTLGVEPVLGRDFSPEEVVGVGPVMLSHRVWQRLFASDPSVVGRTIVSSGQSYEIVGVMPPGFDYPDPSVDTWIAWDMANVYADRPETRTWRFLGGLARLREGQSIASATSELSSVAATLAERHPDANRGWSIAVSSLHEDTVGDVRATLWLAFASVGFILLIACANVANLLLARAPSRAREVGVRAVLGASRRRIAGELVVENLLLGLVAGALGLALGSLMIDWLVAFDAGGIPRLSDVGIDAGVFGFAFTLALATSLLFGAAPLLQLVRGSERFSGSGGVRTTASAKHRRLRDAFVGSQVAIAVVLLTGAGLFATSLERIRQVDPGLDPSNVAVFRVSLDRIDGSEEETVTYYRGLLEAVRGVRGVVDAGASQTLPLDRTSNDFRRPFRPLGTSFASSDAPLVQMRIVTSEYIDVMGMTVLDGEPIPETARLGEPRVAVVNRTLAQRLWPEGDAVGRAFEIDFRDGWHPYTVVGVVQDVKHHGLREDDLPEVFLSHAQAPYLAMTVVAKTVDQPDALFGALRDVVRAHVPSQPAHAFASMENLVAADTAEERFLSMLLLTLASIGLVLASTGVYGVISYSVSHRRREIGVRMALGAGPRSVVSAVFRQALGVAGVGLVVGWALVHGLAGLVDGLLYGVSATDPVTTGLVFLVLASVSCAAAYLPARRAAGIAPSDSLRAE